MSDRSGRWRDPETYSHLDDGTRLADILVRIEQLEQSIEADIASVDTSLLNIRPPAIFRGIDIRTSGLIHCLSRASFVEVTRRSSL